MQVKELGFGIIVTGDDLSFCKIVKGKNGAQNMVRGKFCPLVSERQDVGNQTEGKVGKGIKFLV